MINNIEGSNLDLISSDIQSISNNNFHRFPNIPLPGQVPPRPSRPSGADEFRDRWVTNGGPGVIGDTTYHIIEEWVGVGGFGFWSLVDTVASDHVGLIF